MVNPPVNDCEVVAEVCGAIRIGHILNEKAGDHLKVAAAENAIDQHNRTFHAHAGTIFSNNSERRQYNLKRNACVNVNWFTPYDPCSTY